MAGLDEREILQIFDELVAEGIIIHGPSEIVNEDAEGYPLRFSVCPSLSRKPVVGDKVASFAEAPKWGPGSDLVCADERLRIAKLSGTHNLVLNMFCVDRPQYLLLTEDTYRRQTEPLNLSDLDAALSVVTAFDSIYAIYNGGKAAGCSRMHKHMQALKGSPHAFHLFTSHEEVDDQRIPFRYFKHHFAKGFNNIKATDMLPVYLKLLGHSATVLGMTEKLDPLEIPHNAILCKDWLIVIPRSKPYVGKASSNAGGMLGSPWVADYATIDEWRKEGFSNVLKGLGVPR